MLRIAVLFALITTPLGAAERGEFDPKRAIDRYFEEFEDCRFHGADQEQPSCKSMAIYSSALEANGWCVSGVGLEFRWQRCAIDNAK